MPFPVALQQHIYATTKLFGRFDDVSGGDGDITVTPYFEGGSRSSRKIQGTNDSTDLVVSRAYSPARDNAIVDYWKLAKAGKAAPMPVQVLTEDPTGIVVNVRNYKICVIKGLKYPDGKAGENAISQIQITFAVEE